MKLTLLIPAIALSALAQENHGITFSKWSGAINVPDPVSCTVDPQGRVYVSASTRRKICDLDIREHTAWIPDDVGLTSVEDKKAFYHSTLAPGKMRQPRGGLKDHNKDGSIDWKDLTTASERIYQLRDTDGDGTADKMTVFAEGFNTEVTGIAAGVMAHDGWVYATIAPDLWRLKDTDDDGVADVREVVATGFGVHIAYAGHDMHGLTVGTDGRIYWSIGDKGVNTKSREGRQFSFPNEGCVMRVEPDGSGLEVFAHGLRNPQEPQFNELGDLFAVDNDADFKGELERFVFISDGSDAGWRCNYQYMGSKTPWVRERLWETDFVQAAYILPPLAYSTNGPSGFKRDPGTAMSDALRGMFFLSEFPSGKLVGFRVETHGASFKPSAAQRFHEGIMGVGLSWHPDGSLFVADWDAGYPLNAKGAIWRADVAGNDPKRKETHKLLAAVSSARTVAELSALLPHADQRVRMGAQFELARRGDSAALLAAASDAKGELIGRIHGVWGFGQLLRKKSADSLQLLPLLRDANGEVRAQVARVLGESHASAEQAKVLIPLLSDAEPRARFQAALALGRLRVLSAVDALFFLAEKEAGQPVMRHAAASALAGCAKPEQLAAQKKSPSIALRLACVVALRRQASPLVAEFLADAEPRVVNEAARAIYDDLGISDALPLLAAVAGKENLDELAMLRAVNAGLRVGTSEVATRLLALTLDSSAKPATRAEALDVLLAWSKPSRLDRVDGYARSLKPVLIAHLLEAKLDALLALADPALKTTALELILAHSLKPRPEQIAAIVADNSAPDKVRVEALRLMGSGKRDGDAWKSILETALTAKSGALQRVARELLLPEQPARVVTIAEELLERGKPAERQQVIALLARAGTSDADAVLERLAKSLIAGEADAALQFDILDALQSRPTLAKLAAEYTATPTGAAKRELLAGGASDVGREIVQNHLGANCLACHAIGDEGSTVGPSLKTIGTQRDAAYLLDSLLNPSAAITPGFGLATFSLRDKTNLAGTILSTTSDALTIRLPDGSERKLKLADIATQTPSVSVMPPMLGIMKPKEIRDVVAYLSSLKGKPAKAK